MVELAVKRIAEKRGITTPYQLQLKAQIFPSVASRLWKGTVIRMPLDLIDKLCVALECVPGDLFNHDHAKSRIAKVG